MLVTEIGDVDGNPSSRKVRESWCRRYEVFFAMTNYYLIYPVLFLFCGWFFIAIIGANLPTYDWRA